MMGTLAKGLAEKDIKTPSEYYWADVEGSIEDVNGVLKITRIAVTYHMKLFSEKVSEANNALASYLSGCPAAQSVIGCIDIQDNAIMETLD
jgi:hypothetical protein